MARSKRRLPRTSRRVRRSWSWAFSILFCLGGIALLGLGASAWFAPRQPPVQIARDRVVNLQRTPLLDEGVTIFANAGDRATGPDKMSCELITKAASVPAVALPAPNTGTRVKHDVSLEPIISLGRPGAGDQVVCRGVVIDDTTVWLLPTQPQRSGAGIALFIAGVGCFGMSALSNPRLRGFTAR